MTWKGQYMSDLFYIVIFQDLGEVGLIIPITVEEIEN